MRVIGYEARANSMREFRGVGVGGGLSGRGRVGAGSVSNVVHAGAMLDHAGSVLVRCWVGVYVGSVSGRCWVGAQCGICWVNAGSVLGRCWVHGNLCESMCRFLNLCEDLCGDLLIYPCEDL